MSGVTGGFMPMPDTRASVISLFVSGWFTIHVATFAYSGLPFFIPLSRRELMEAALPVLRTLSVMLRSYDIYKVGIDIVGTPCLRMYLTLSTSKRFTSSLLSVSLTRAVMVISSIICGTRPLCSFAKRPLSSCFLALNSSTKRCSSSSCSDELIILRQLP